MTEPRKRRLLRFVLVGGVNAAFGYGVYGAALYLGWPLALALALANVTGVAFNFVTNGRLVFDDRDPRKFPRFVLAYVLAWLVGTVLVAGLSRLEPSRILDFVPALREIANRHRPTALDDFVAGVLLLPVSALGTFWLLSRLVYRDEPVSRERSSGTK